MFQLSISTSVSTILRTQVMRESDVPFFSVPASASISKSNSESVYAGCIRARRGDHHDRRQGCDVNRQIHPRTTFPDGMAYTILVGKKKLAPPEFDLGWMSGTRSSLRGAGIAINFAVGKRRAFPTCVRRRGGQPARRMGLPSRWAIPRCDSSCESIRIDVYRQLGFAKRRCCRGKCRPGVSVGLPLFLFFRFPATIRRRLSPGRHRFPPNDDFVHGFFSEKWTRSSPATTPLRYDPPVNDFACESVTIV